MVRMHMHDPAALELPVDPRVMIFCQALWHPDNTPELTEGRLFFAAEMQLLVDLDEMGVTPSSK